MFTPIKNTKVYEQVIQQIKDMVMEGVLKKGDKLPSERELAERLQVSRTSIREALRSLEIIGLIESKQGEGNFIKSSFENNLFNPLSIMFMLQKSDPREILELRQIIEKETAALAAKKILDEEITDLGFIIEEFKTCKEEEKLVKIDREFHYKIAKASKNFIILNIFEAISSLMELFIKNARENILMDSYNRPILIKQHENIYKAIAKRDEKEALRSMTKHLELINKYIED